MTPSLILLDTSFLVAAYSSEDALHSQAVKLRRSNSNGQFLLLEYVFLELATVLAMRVSVSLSNQTLSLMLDTPDITFVPCSALFTETLRVFQAQEKFALSFVDCALIAAMNFYQAEILTFDKELIKFAKSSKLSLRKGIT